MPLVEITTDHDISHPEDAIHLIIELMETLKNLQISNARMENGELRVDTNISLKRKSDGFEGPRFEIKEIDRLRDVELAIDHEVIRQHALIESGKEMKSEDRIWDPVRKDTVFYRTKTQRDYLYMRDPDLPRLNISKERIQSQAENIQLPITQKTHLIDHYELSVPQTAQIFRNAKAIPLFELLASSRDSGLVYKWIFVHILSYCQQHDLDFDSVIVERFPGKKLAKVIDLSEKFGLSDENGIKIIGQIINGDDRNPAEIAAKEELLFKAGEASLEDNVKMVIQENASVISAMKDEKNTKPVKILVKEVENLQGSDKDLDKAKEMLLKEIGIEKKE